MARTHSIEAEVTVGTYQITDFYVLGEQNHKGFPMKSSTPLYQEWAFAVLPGVDEEIWSSARTPLLDMREYDTAAIIGEHAGFALPGSYLEEAKLDFQLNLMDPASNVCLPGWARDLSRPLQPCQECGVGRFNNDGSPECAPCEADFYNDELGALACKRCPLGKIAYNSGEASCTDQKDVMLYRPIKACEAFPDKQLNVGVLWEDGSQNSTLAQWKPTFEDVLNDYFNRYQCFFKMQAIPPASVESAIQAKTIDLFFSNSGMITSYQNEYGLKPLSAVLRVFRGRVYPRYGGVIFSSVSRNISGSLEDLEALAKTRNLSVCTAYKGSFTGWTVQWFEFFKRGIDISRVFKHVVVAETHAKSIAGVLSGECDVGMVRTGALEQLADESTVKIHDWYIINQQVHEGFTLVISTDLYPEWSFAGLSHVSSQITDVVSIPLLAMREGHPAALAGGHAGFTSWYAEPVVSNIIYQLGLDPSKTCGPGNYRDLTTALTPCRVCPSGFVSDSGIGPCEACPLNQVSADPGGVACVECPFGMGTTKAGSSQCEPYEELINLSPVGQITLWILSSLVFGFCFGVCGMVVKYRQTRLIKASSFEFSVVLILSCGVVAASTVLFAITPAEDNWICALRWWIPCVFASIVFGTLFSKTFRLFSIFRIYETKQQIPKSIKFKDTKVAGLVACFVLVTLIVLAIFFLVDPPFYVENRRAPEGQHYYTVVQACKISKVFVPLVFSLYVLLLTSQSWLAFRVRKLPTVFNESQLIAWLLYNTVFIGLVGIMVDFMLGWDATTAKMMVRAMALLIGSLTPVSVLYVPKLMAIFREQGNASTYSDTHNKSKPTTNHSARTGIQNPTAINNPITSSKVGLTRHQKSNKSALSALSCVSGASDVDGDEEKLYKFDIQVVPDSDLAGDEDITQDDTQASEYLRSYFATAVPTISSSIGNSDASDPGEPKQVRVSAKPRSATVRSAAVGIASVRNATAGGHLRSKTVAVDVPAVRKLNESSRVMFRRKPMAPSPEPADMDELAGASEEVLPATTGLPPLEQAEVRRAALRLHEKKVSVDKGEPVKTAFPSQSSSSNARSSDEDPRTNDREMKHAQPRPTLSMPERLVEENFRRTLDSASIVTSLYPNSPDVRNKKQPQKKPDSASTMTALFPNTKDVRATTTRNQDFLVPSPSSGTEQL
eukprot:gb/GEZN01000601.1/.p1 GENE.gb/GEZN01000601.1/~~gb/GEZN01000601.1/.p1  ORF type:complete len:1258 (+),score=189.92 gb/GEZN01000601.1/:245-3775(+)